MVLVAAGCGGVTRYGAATGSEAASSGPAASVASGGSLGTVAPGGRLDAPAAYVAAGSQTFDYGFDVAPGAGRLRVTLVLSNRDDCAPALRELGFEGQDVERKAGDAHLARVHERLRDVLRAKPDATLVMTGRAQSIQALRSRLKGDGERATPKVKAYWAVGKAGLD